MQVAALYDIHGNLPALEAVLGRIAQLRVDRIVVGGDVVCGPMTRDVVRSLSSASVPVDFIQGNAEVSVLAEMRGADQKRPLPAPVQQIVRWEAQQLREHQDLLASWPMTLRQRIPGIGDVLFCHATPRDEDEIFLRSTPDDVLEPIFAGVDADLVVCGHTHMQFDRAIGKVRVVNAGSVGMAFGVPGAYWLLLGPDVRLQCTTYDRASAADRIRATRYPHAHEFAEKHVLHPPSEAAMLDVFRKVALK